MKRTLLKLHAVVTMDSSRRIMPGGAIDIKDGVILDVLSADTAGGLHAYPGDVVDCGGLVAIPGLIQTHVHLCQTLFRGLADDLSLLDWLRIRIFPLEAAHTDASLRASALLGLAELIRSGTTTIMDMGTVHGEGEIVRAIEETGMRAFVGKALMDINDACPHLREPAQTALSSARKEADQWHGRCNGRVRYAVAPRFVLSCTEGLLREAFEMTAGFPGMLFHTHAAENRDELDAVRRRCGTGNIDYFEKLGILQPRTCLAHCIWLDKGEVDLLSGRGAKVLHCPSSNLKLGSGIADVPLLLSRGITVSLGADGAPCNNRLDMFEEMRLASLLQKPLHGPSSMPARTALEMATLGGAATLGIDREAGSIEPGKKADIVLLDLRRTWNPSGEAPEDLYASIVYSGTPENVRSVMVDGKWLYRDGVHTTIDEQKAVRSAREELSRLLRRAG